jgi:uncharacterized protein YcfJ
MKRISTLIFWQVCLLSPLLAFSPQTAPPAPAEPQSITLPIGTEIAIRTIDRIDSKTADLQREYAASLDDPIIVDGVTVVPANANAFLRVTDKQRSGITRRASLSTSLVAVTINGQRVEVETGKVDSKSGSQAKRTLTGTAVGAGTGAAIGAIAGGALGAGIGAAAGGAAGTVGGILMGKTVEIAAETRFTYTLRQPAVIGYQQTASAPGESVASNNSRPGGVAGTPGEAPPQTVASAQQTPTDAALPPIAPPPPDEQQAPPKTPMSGSSEPEFIGAVYLQNESGALIPLERKKGTRRTGQTDGTGSGAYWEMEGSKSPIRLKSGQKMFFVVRLANGIDPASFSLFPLETKKDSRRTESDPRNKAARLTLLFNVTKVGESTYGLTPVEDLAVGEYAFSPRDSDDAYCFGVDPVTASAEKTRTYDIRLQVVSNSAT